MQQSYLACPGLLEGRLVFFYRQALGADLNLGGIAFGPLFLACRPGSFLVASQSRSVFLKLLARLGDRSLGGWQRIASPTRIQRLGSFNLWKGRDGREKQKYAS